MTPHEYAQGFSEIINQVAYSLGLDKSFNYALAITEDHSSKISELKTVIKDGQLMGSKIFVSKGFEADKFIILAKEKNAYSLVLVDKHNIKIEEIDKTCLTGVSMTAIDFNTDLFDYIGEKESGYFLFQHLICHERVLMSSLFIKHIESIEQDVKEYFINRQYPYKVNKDLKIFKQKYKEHKILLEELNLENMKKIAKYKVEASEFYFKIISEGLEKLGARAFQEKYKEYLNNALASKIYSGANFHLKELK